MQTAVFTCLHLVVTTALHYSYAKKEVHTYAYTYTSSNVIKHTHRVGLSRVVYAVHNKNHLP